MQVKRWFSLMMLFALLGIVSTSFAQPPILGYGSGNVSEVNATTPLVAYGFAGEAGDLVTVRIISLSAGFNPTLSINSPIGQQIAFGASDATSAGEGNVRIDILLPDSGTFSIQVGSSDGGQGQFAIRLDGVSAQNAPTLQTPMELDFVTGPSTQVLTFDASPTSTLNLEAPDADVLIYNADGLLLGVAAAGTSFAIPAGSASYYAVVSSTGESTTPVQIGLYPGSGAAPSTANPVSTAVSPPSDASVCTITTGGTGTNLRTGPGTSYGIIASLAPNQSYPVTGQNSGWYTINYNGTQGWLAGSATTRSGPCDGLTTVPVPSTSDPVQPASTSTPTSSTLPTATSSTDTSPTQTEPATGQTATSTPTEATTDLATATTAPTATPTESTAQVAPPDNAYFVDINIKGGQATHSDRVSFPDGDVEDEIFWDVSGFDSITTSGDLQIIITCTGNGQSNVSFTMASATYSCGDVINRFVTNVNDGGLIRARATGGDNILVNYSLLFLGTP